MAPPKRSLKGPGSSPWTFVKSLYTNEFRWDCVKSIGLFSFGVYMALEFKGLELGPVAGAAPN